MLNKKYILFFLISVGVFCFCKAKKEAESNSAISVSSNQAPVSVSPEMVEAVEGLNLGNLAPEIELKNPKDETIKLSSLRGKIVLVDFWASWCGPCRYENPTVVRAYKKYKSAKLKNASGFIIYSVSLDMNKQLWEAAIQKDSLVWPYHVSDLQGWNNVAAQKYAVYGIPTNYLLDAKGIIIAKALRGEDLEKALETQIAK